MGGLVHVVMCVVVMVVGVVVMVSAATATGFAECTHNNDCGDMSCCLVGLQRYSIPQCTVRGGLGDYCKNHKPDSFDLHYPNNIKIVMQAAHRGLCPCQPGLQCSSRTSKCESPRRRPTSHGFQPFAYAPPPSSLSNSESEEESRSLNSIE